MSMTYDIIVLGSGPSGQKAAIQGAKVGQRVLMIERDRTVGGACVHHGTIPSKTLRETALLLSQFKQQCANVFALHVPEDIQVRSLMTRLQQVVEAHERYMGEQLQRNGIEQWHGRARFVSPHDIDILCIDGSHRLVSGEIIVIATGSRPRTPVEIPVDHEYIVDSDSILSMRYLPASLTVLGSGVIASEYASIFAALGVQVTMVDRGERPLAFLEEEFTERFLQGFAKNGGHFLGRRNIVQIAWDGVSAVETTLDSGEVLQSEKMLCALGRVANTEGLNLSAAGLELTSRGFIAVNDACRTSVPHIYAVGDVIGPPALASCAMEQGRRAICDALGLGVQTAAALIPMGIYTIPEIASVGLGEREVRERYGSAMVGRANFAELARGQIAGSPDGLLKLVADPQGEKLLGVHIVGATATELIHVGQMGLLSDCEVDTFVEHIFNFPTFAEAYRVAALDIVKQRRNVGPVCAVSWER